MPVSVGSTIASWGRNVKSVAKRRPRSFRSRVARWASAASRVAMPSFTQTSSYVRMVTQSPIHWWASSCALSEKLTQPVPEASALKVMVAFSMPPPKGGGRSTTA